MKPDKAGVLTALLLSCILWTVHFVWLAEDTRPPVWDMALHQTYALNYLGEYAADAEEAAGPWEKTGNYPPLVHLGIAFLYLIFHPGPHIAVLVNIPATFILFWSVYELAKDYGGRAAGQWACLLTALTPYLIWISRETILDYWLSAWFAAGLVVLRKTQGFRSRPWSLLLGCILALGLLTKWFMAGFMLVPLLLVFVEFRTWKHFERSVNFADALIIAGIGAGFWYFPNIPQLARHFVNNAAIGALEGEPPVFSFQSLIYYLRLLEGYQLFGILFAVLCLACVFLWKKQRIGDWRFLLFSIAGGWLVMTLLRTKDPRFTMPLLGPLSVISGTWIQSWTRTRVNRILQSALIALLLWQAYAVNFGVSWMPDRVVLFEGYQGSLRWDWNLYLQDYFNILGKPKKEDWKLEAILRKVVAESEKRRVEPTLALVPDLPWLNEANFTLYARLRKLPVKARHLKSSADGVRCFEGYNYVLMTEGEQGMSWTTRLSEAMNKIIVDHHQVFQLIEIYSLPSGDGARLYFNRAGGGADRAGA